jgi:hypothetical protein
VTLNRKASLLLQPFSVKAGGYLPGYLAVKSLWRAATRKCPLLANETDLFLMYLRGYIYNDWAFVATLLSEETNEIRSAESIVNHLNDRIREWDNLSEQGLSEFENSIAAHRGPDPPLLRGLRVPDSAAASGRQRLNNLTNELSEDTRADESMTTAIAAWSTSVLHRRQFMNLASVPVELCKTVDGLPEVQWQRCSLLKPTRSDFTANPKNSLGKAQLEVVFELRQDRFERAVVVHRGNKVLVCIPLGLKDDANETRRSIRRAFLGRPLVIKAEETMRTMVDHVVRKSWFRVAIDHCSSQVDGIIDEFFKDLSLRFARDYDAIDNCASSMTQTGFRAILNSSALVKGLALLGLATSLNPAANFVKDIFEKHTLSLSRTLDELNAAYKVRGYPPRVLHLQNALFTTV